MSTRDLPIQSLTAYRCRICKKYRNEDLLIKSKDNPTPLVLEEILRDFFKYIERCKIDRYTSRALMLSTPFSRVEINDSDVIRLHIQPSAGKALENFSVVNHRTNALRGYKGADHSAVYVHNVLFYFLKEQNVIVFHHYGQSGCKTAFLNTLNEFLAPRGLIAHLDVLLSNSMFNSAKKYAPEKVSLITTYSDNSSDKADNIGKKKRKNIEQEVIISLNAPRAKNIKEWFQNITTKEPTVEELKSILIKDNFPGEFEDAKLTIKFGKVRRSISLSEFTGVIAEYDVTDQLELLADGSVGIESLYEIADEYAAQFLKINQEG